MAYSSTLSTRMWNCSAVSFSAVLLGNVLSMGAGRIIRLRFEPCILRGSPGTKQFIKQSNRHATVRLSSWSHVFQSVRNDDPGRTNVQKLPGFSIYGLRNAIALSKKNAAAECVYPGSSCADHPKQQAPWQDLLHRSGRAAEELSTAN